ncbi:FAD-binding oxidoreductase [Poseidonocella sp. HB161398]|uniref:NAD(P)/FAD-dependent oxidoreductase n=1 Tax=Poseidonocella sp. HB161398 TaxID=2320855 RepID=UPI001109E58B|nr:FAD-dependent oxidoreductase [Poseidonocella sp. HB161398]
MTGAREPQAALWHDSCRETASGAPLDAPTTADLAIVGAGFTGCAAALEAAGRGLNVILLEAGRISDGGSGRNVGLVNAGLWLPPDTVLAQMGEAAGRRLITALAAGPQEVFALIERHGIDCEPRRAGTLHLAHSPAGLRDLGDRLAQGLRHGAPLALLDRAETGARTGSRAFHGALLDPRAGTVQPRAYCTGLARAAIAAGARLHEASPVTSVAALPGGGWRLAANGHEIRAGALLIATNAYHRPAAGMAAPQHAVVAYSQYATAPLPAALRAQILPGGEGCWDTAMVMSSIRTDSAGRLILGGMGDAGGPGRAVHDGWARRKLRRLYPALGALPFVHRWQGRIAMTADHVPKVLELGPGGYAVFGYSGRGIAPGTVFGRAAAAALAGDGPGAFPLPVCRAHAEPFRKPLSAWYEAGATLVHAVDPPPFAR